MKLRTHEWLEATFVVMTKQKGEPGIVTKRNFYERSVANYWLEKQKEAANTLGLCCHFDITKRQIEVWVEGETNLQDAMRLASLEHALKSQDPAVPR